MQPRSVSVSNLEWAYTIGGAVFVLVLAAIGRLFEQAFGLEGDLIAWGLICCFGFMIWEKRKAEDVIRLLPFALILFPANNLIGRVVGAIPMSSFGWVMNLSMLAIFFVLSLKTVQLITRQFRASDFHEKPEVTDALA